ncbi:Arc family DNA-binding protein [Brachybacterium sp. J153]|uniref:Arc family DNA-binding protein n=1 Tax=Brachybacterium sp. J153 TaxID=3116488 RepID=UPI002E77A1B1|nr:Arc family DNA-binding protein [Brachybacterium sp. J153]MEE1619727.1 Arc family DNA-binding protein [Brachybacterium sp. J153]
MSTTRQRAKGGGRPGKGDRHPFAVRVPREYADRVMAYADATGRSYNDVIVAQLVKHIDELDVEAVELGHNRLDVDTDMKAS